MILHSIKVENWRCILGERSAGPFSEGINILHAPNATGKSTLFEALRCALMDSHSAKGKEVERLRPWGRRLSPVVEVEFTSGGVRYRVRKGFLDSALSLLERMENGAYQPVAKGTDADTMTRALFTKDAPKKGMSRPEHWGILQVLWAPQGMLEVGELSGNLLDDIRTSITAQVVDDRARAVEELLGRRSETWFTPTGKEKSAGPLATLRKEIEDAEGRLEALRMERGEAEASSRRVRALSEREEELRGEVARMEEDRKRLEERAVEYGKFRAEHDRRAADAKVAESEYVRLRETVERIDEADREMASVAKRIEERRSALPSLEAAREESAKSLATAIAELEAARAEVEATEASAELARAARRVVELRGLLRTLVERDSSANKTRNSLAGHEQERSALACPSLADMKKIRKAFADFDRADAELNASRVGIEIHPSRSRKMVVEAGEETHSHDLEAGRPVIVQGYADIRLDIEGFGVLRAYSVAGTPREAEEAKSKARQQIEKLSAPFGTSDRTDLEELHERGFSLDTHIELERAELNALLGKDTIETLSGRIRQVETELSALLEARPAWREADPDPEALAETAEEAGRKAAERLRAAETGRDEASKASSDAEMSQKLAEQGAEADRRSLESLEERLRALQADGRTQEERRKDLTSLALGWDAAKGAAEECAERLKKLGGDPDEELKAGARALKARTDELRRTEEDRIRESARLDTFAARGLHTLVSDLEERLEELKRRLARERLAADSTRLLLDTFKDCRAEMSRSVTERASRRATEIYSRIVGADQGELRLAESMAPSGFVPKGLDAPVGVEALSGGEREQLHFAVRMALADCSGSGERRLLVLDDTLMATDSIRFQRILKIVEEAAKELQILILTCQPERFERLSDANRVDLASLLGTGDARTTAREGSA